MWKYQDKLDSDSGVSIRGELMDFLHLVTLLGFGPGPEPRQTTSGGADVVDPTPHVRNLQAAVVGAVQGSTKCSPGAEKPWREGGTGMEIKTTVQQGAGPRP